MTSRVTGPDWVPEGLEQYNGCYPRGLEHHDALDADDSHALVRLSKYCAECGRVFEGWEFANRVENMKAVAHPDDPDTELVVGTCDACVERWEAGRERRNLQLAIEQLDKKLARATQKKAALSIGYQLLEHQRRLRGLLSPGSPSYTETDAKIAELEKTLAAISVMSGAA